MMQFLKSILLRNKHTAHAEQLEQLRVEVDILNAEVQKLHEGMQTVAQSYITLSQEIAIVSDNIRQAANMAKQSEFEYPPLMIDEPDDGGYLN